VKGTVYLVGAGPGDPRLLTLRGAELLRRADVVVYDRLAPSELLALAPAEAELVDVGKMPGSCPVGQVDINRLLVDRARRGLSVVRLKGGDPFVFGRGGEECLALFEAGIEFEVVPGVSSVVAAPAHAGIPLTHRGLSSSFAVVTASLADDKRQDFRRTATGVDTLVVMMAAGKLREVSAALIEAGRSANEPAAVIACATTYHQLTVAALLGNLADAADRARIQAPATLVVGPVVALSDRLAWFEAAAHTEADMERLHANR
jgi:uroporphyrinogen III methyltransferase / synthase